MSFTCPICLDDDRTNIESVGTLQPCNHNFHTHCLRRWHIYAHDLLCPICRVESNILLVRLSDDQSMSPIEVDLRKGFDAKRVIEYERQEEHFLRRFNDALRIGSSLSRQERLVLTQCNICGGSESQLDKACHSCGTLFHESCLRSLACEVGDPSSWQQCVECRAPVNQFRRSHADHGRGNSTHRGSQMPDELTRLREVKARIQEHVRRVLQEFYQGSDRGNIRIKIDKRHFTDINKRVSRKLYRVSNYRYLRGIIDYDMEARREVYLELRKLGYIDV
ncbi:hypothetical protein ZYGR_0AI07380 [Zygosaccharomyces rouxii]|uniref:RING-type domain-containing protein n=1 Tax=Zygosaccharomyces rouxii TaxID=4956 RepID=A0A1Q3ACF2_ZYGRO|nr:hypothetical protein ZYGR_0AI07380 [Zygosaccharomyces rouxii]